MGETAEISEGLAGDKLYQKRAREALPLLVRQALAQSTIYYSDLARELGMPNPRNLNFPLGSIGQALLALSEEWGEEIPAIQCLVINKRDRLPGRGVGWFIENEHQFDRLPLAARQELVWMELHKVFSYPKWPVVLKALGLHLDHGEALSQARMARGGGESKRHKGLKRYISEHPQAIGLPATAKVETEFALPSGDHVDVLLRLGSEWIAVEVKSASSPMPDIVRGLFQCVKYRAVIEAFQAASGLQRDARAILVTENSFPAELVQIKQILNVDVRDGIHPK